MAPKLLPDHRRLWRPMQKVSARSWRESSVLPAYVSNNRSVAAKSKMAARFIAHLDMDAFYASVELLRYPQLRGRPLVIGGRRRNVQDAAGNTAFPTLRNYAGRGVITTATYEARAF